MRGGNNSSLTVFALCGCWLLMYGRWVIANCTGYNTTIKPPTQNRPPSTSPCAVSPHYRTPYYLSFLIHVNRPATYSDRHHPPSPPTPAAIIPKGQLRPVKQLRTLKRIICSLNPLCADGVQISVPSTSPFTMSLHTWTLLMEI